MERVESNALILLYAQMSKYWGNTRMDRLQGSTNESKNGAS